MDGASSLHQPASSNSLLTSDLRLGEQECLYSVSWHPFLFCHFEKAKSSDLDPPARRGCPTPTCNKLCAQHRFRWVKSSPMVAPQISTEALSTCFSLPRTDSGVRASGKHGQREFPSLCAAFSGHVLPA